MRAGSASRFCVGSSPMRRKARVASPPRNRSRVITPAVHCPNRVKAFSTNASSMFEWLP
ncbi:MAG: hypothetical protein KatS3mg042_0382 [Rhodothermaceae bacterium]|nr:MAG: hypothetical protein KatS3mg042_0382 [Rhodothermaceae bacterium]